jgi:hypothetical protein
VQGAFEAKLLRAGWEAWQAQELATFITAAIEGGIMLCRTYHSGEPLRVVAVQLKHLISSSAAPRPSSTNPTMEQSTRNGG